MMSTSAATTNDANVASEENTEIEKILPLMANDYGHAYWLNGWRKIPNDESADILCFETGHYGLVLQVNDLTMAKFGRFVDESLQLSYTDALEVGNDNRNRMAELVEESLRIEVQVDGTAFRAKTCIAGQSKTRSKARLWEAGRFVQNYELVGLVFTNDERGCCTDLQCQADLFVVVWPRSFSFVLKVRPSDGAAWANGANISIDFGQWSTEEVYDGEWDATLERSVALECHLDNKSGEIDGIDINVSGSGLPAIVAKYHSDFICYVVRAKDVVRQFRCGYCEICDYDTFDLVLKNTGVEGAYVPFLFELTNPANITGVVPILCFPDGTPTGIPVQLSKNWHNSKMGPYVRAYTLLPAAKNSSVTFKLVFVYGFYGTLPSASHSNLSLVGWNDDTNGRWEQLAIGCWGETHCLDAEFSATGHNIITDVRALMVRDGTTGTSWSWTNAGWGGDWLDAYDSQDRRLYPKAVKVAYISQGPCLTEVQYGGYYGGVGGSYLVSFRNTVRTLRTDDYARTFYDLNFNFHDTVSFRHRNQGQVCCLFRVGGCGWEALTTPRIAVGNSEGLIKEYNIPNDLSPNSFFKEFIELAGTGPWWIAYPGMRCHKSHQAQAWRALVIQSYTVNVSGKMHDKPVVSFFVRHRNEGEVAPNVDALITLPEECEELGEGDSALMNVYWITLPHSADDYYGPNKTFGNHLGEKPDSWETVLREVQGNNLEVKVIGGEIRLKYPLVIESIGNSEIHVQVKGGVGAVPMRFDGLESGLYKLYKLSTDGNECKQSLADTSWQTNYDADALTYSVTYNVVLDGIEISSWMLKK